ncbi:MAG TPA: hypothetical protein DCX12_10510 [Chloroflexi bacterium]|nr:hypothetical protein [Chloroflexota bacterium]
MTEPSSIRCRACGHLAHFGRTCDEKIRSVDVHQIGTRKVMFLRRRPCDCRVSYSYALRLPGRGPSC